MDTSSVQELPLTEQSESTTKHSSVPSVAKRFMLAKSVRETVAANESQTITASAIVYDLTDKKLISAHGIDVEHYAASTQKIPVVALVLQDIRKGKLSLDTQLSWATTDQRAGAGEFDQPGAPTTGTVRQVIFDLLNKSSNTAVRVLVNKTLGGATVVNTRLAAYPQLKVTRLQPLEGDAFFVGYTTARESAYIFKEFYRHNDPATTYAKTALATNIFNDYGPRSQIQDPNKVAVIDKQGMLNDPEGNNRHDIGVIRNKQNGHLLQYNLFTTSPGTSETLIAPAETSLQTIGRAMLTYQGDTAAQPNAQRKGNSSIPQAYIEQGRVRY